MNAAELRLKIFREVDILNNSKLKDLYGVLVDFLSSHEGTEEWSNLTSSQRKAIMSAIEQVKSGEIIPNSEIIDKFRKRYTSAK